MQTVSSTFLNALTGSPKRLAVVVEIYHQDAAPGEDGFDPADSNFIAGFADRAGITFRTRSYQRLLTSKSSINRILEKRLSSASFSLSNLEDSNGDRLAYQFERDFGFEGLICVFRLLDWSTSSDLADSSVLFTGRCRKPSNFKRSNNQTTITVEQILNQVDTVIPRRKFTSDDAEGRAESDPHFEGFRFVPRSGQVSFKEKVRRGGILGLFGLKKTVTRYLQWSSKSDVSAETSVPVILGRVQAEAIHIGFEDVGTEVHQTSAFCDGEIAAIENIRSVTQGLTLTPANTNIKTGKLGGVGNQLADDPGFVANAIYSRLAYIRTIAVGSELSEDDGAPTIIAIILGMLMPLPDSNGDYVNNGWSDSPAHLIRWLINSEDYFGLGDAWLDDAEFNETHNYCDHVLVDQARTDDVFYPSSQIGIAGTNYLNYLSTGALNYQSYLAYLGSIDEHDIGTRQALYQYYGSTPYNSDDPTGTGSPGFQIGNTPTSYRKRYTANVAINEETPAIDFLFDVLMASANLFLVQKANGKLALRAKRPVDTTFMRTASVATDDEIHVEDITKFKDNLGRILIGANLSTSEVREVTGTRFDTSVSIPVTASGGISTSSATLTGGSTTTPRTATLTVTLASGTKTVTIDGYQTDYSPHASDTTSTIAGRIAGQINSHEALNKFVKAIWNDDATITLESKVGYLELDTALENAHAVALADPVSAPTAASQGSGSLRAGTYYIAYSYENGSGETLISPTKEITITADKNIGVSAVSLPAGATGINWYASIEPNGVRLHHVFRNDGMSWTLSADNLPRTDDRPEPYANLTAEECHRVAMAFSDIAETQSNLTRSNMVKGTFEYIPGSRESYNEVEIKYRDASQDFELVTLRVKGKVNQNKIKKVKKLEINGAAIDNHHQARRIANQILNENLDGDSFMGFTSVGEALLLEEGDVIAVTEDTGEFKNEAVRIEKITISISSKGMPLVTIQGRKYRRYFYDDQVVEKLVRLPIVQNNPVNTAQGAPVIIQPVSPPTSPTAQQLTVQITGGQTNISARYRRIRVSENSDMSGYTETILQASTLDGVTSPYQVVNNPNPEATANTRYIQIALSTNGTTFGENSNILTVTYAGTSSGSGSSGDTQNSDLSAAWDDGNGEVDLSWVIGTGTAAQTVETKLSSEGEEGWTELSNSETAGNTTYSDSRTKGSSSVNRDYRVKDNNIAGWSNVASVTIPAAPQPPTLTGSFDNVNDEVDLTATAGENGSGNFTFERKVTGQPDSSYTVLATQASGSYSDSQVPGATARSYTYRVKQATPSGEYSGTVTVEIPAENDEPTLDSAAWNTDELDVTWTNNGGANNIEVQYSEAGANSYNSGTPTFAPGAGSGSISILQDIVDTYYDIRLYQSDTGYSNVIENVLVPGTGGGGGPS